MTLKFDRFSLMLHKKINHSQVESTLNISNSDISNYPVMSKDSVDTLLSLFFSFQLFLSQTTDISK